MENPIVSFCITTFERYEILEELLFGILSVNSNRFEIVVCDDCSTDDSVDRLKKINDKRLKIFVNKKRLGALQNMYNALEYGSGEYLFFVNDRDNVDSFKIEKLMEILNELKKENVAFAKCYVTADKGENYHIYSEKEEKLLEFSCRIAHPTGYIFRKEIWKSIENRKKLFANEDYGDYPFTQICAIMALKYNGAVIYGNICDVLNERLDFTKEKSRYHWKRKDKRLWYSPEVIFRELKIGQKFLKNIGVQESIREKILLNRYAECLPWCVTKYKEEIANPVYTTHYDIYPHQDFLHIFINSVWNGIKLWRSTYFSCANGNRKLRLQINQVSKREYREYFECLLNDILPVRGKLVRDSKKKDDELYKREEILKTYEIWINASINKKIVSEYLYKKGYHHVAIYGMGRIGRNLWKEFRNSNIQVDYIIDQKLSSEAQGYEEVPCLHMGSEFPDVDIIIVTIVDRSEIIIKELRKKTKCPVRMINDILFVL